MRVLGLVQPRHPRQLHGLVGMCPPLPPVTYIGTGGKRINRKKGHRVAMVNTVMSGLRHSTPSSSMTSTFKIISMYRRCNRCYQGILVILQPVFPRKFPDKPAGILLKLLWSFHSLLEEKQSQEFRINSLRIFLRSPFKFVERYFPLWNANTVFLAEVLYFFSWDDDVCVWNVDLFPSPPDGFYLPVKPDFFFWHVYHPLIKGVPHLGHLTDLQGFPAPTSIEYPQLGHTHCLDVHTPLLKPLPFLPPNIISPS